jgi:hypothetical protein
MQSTHTFTQSTQDHIWPRCRPQSPPRGCGTSAVQTAGDLEVDVVASRARYRPAAASSPPAPLPPPPPPPHPPACSRRCSARCHTSAGSTWLQWLQCSARRRRRRWCSSRRGAARSPCARLAAPLVALGAVSCASGCARSQTCEKNKNKKWKLMSDECIKR